MYNGKKISLILTCAGKGERAGFNKNKLLIPFFGATCLEKTLAVFKESNLIDEFILTASAEDYDQVVSLAGDGVNVVVGGATRTQSVKNALNGVSGDITVIHDGARPFVSYETVLNCIAAAEQFGGAAAAVPTRDTIVEADKIAEDEIARHVGKKGLYLIQTPQTFITSKIKTAYSLIGDKTYNDDAEIFNEFIGAVKIVKSDYANVKLTFKEDFSLLNACGGARFGTGFDCHRFAENRKLILGGIEIPYNKGLLGHSDADVLTHAVMDALLSAAALRDIGFYFPDNDDAYLNADSMELLKKVIALLREKRLRPFNVSATIMAEKPKLSAFIPKICEKLALALGISRETVGVSATTLEGLGFVGREEGICASAVVSLIPDIKS